MIPREMLLEPEVYAMEKNLTKKLHHAIHTLSPLFDFQENNHELPNVEITNKLVNMSYNPFLNRVRACVYDSPFLNSEIGEEAGHYIHFRKNPLFGKYSDEDGLEARHLIECVGRFSGLAYSAFIGEKTKPITDLQEDLIETHESSYNLAGFLFENFGESFLVKLGSINPHEFKKLKNCYQAGEVK